MPGFRAASRRKLKGLTCQPVCNLPKASLKIGAVAGIGVDLHLKFIILLGSVGFSHYLQRHRWEDAASGLGFISALFAVIVLHELGHALTAKRFGIRTRDVTLLPIGGVARLSEYPTSRSRSCSWRRQDRR